MTNIRLLGVVIALAVVTGAFFHLRGERWSRVNFLLAVAIAVVLAFVSIEPNAANVIRDAFNFGGFEYGRLLGLLVLSNLGLIFLTLYTKSKIDRVTHLFDRSLRATAADAVEPTPSGPMPDVMVIIPALNEVENLDILLPRIPRTVAGLSLGILVVDDGSTDGTKQTALRHGCFVARSVINRGQGAASRIGYTFLGLHGVHYGVTMDADNQHRPEDIERLLQPVLANRFDLCIGSRVLGSAEQDSMTRSIGVAVFSRLVSLLSGVRLTDCSSGFKAFDMRKMARLDLRENQFQSSEVLITAAKRGLRIGEVPIRINRRDVGESRKGTNLSYGLMFFRTMARTWWR
jgi:hypothetical protein